MATPTLDALTAQVIAYFRSRYPTRDLGSESFLGKLAAATAMSIFGLYKATSDVTADAIPSSSTSSDRLDDFAYLFGLSNGSGGFGRKGAVAATGGLGPRDHATGTEFVHGLPPHLGERGGNDRIDVFQPAGFLAGIEASSARRFGKAFIQRRDELGQRGNGAGVVCDMVCAAAIAHFAEVARNTSGNVKPGICWDNAPRSRREVEFVHDGS
jgi:hypothetical protein